MENQQNDIKPEPEPVVPGLPQEKRRLLIILGVCCLLLLGIGQLLSRHTAPLRPKPNPVIKKRAGPVYPDPPGIVLHDSDSPARVQGRPFDAAMLEEIHAQDHPGWATVFEGKIYHIGYHYVILPDGTIQQGRPDHCTGCHTKKHNNWLGICIIGGFSTNRHWWPSTPTHRQVLSTIRLCRYLMAKYHIPVERVKRHRDLRLTWCPGDRFPYRTIMAALRASTALQNKVHAVTVAAPHIVQGLRLEDAEDR